MPIHWGEKTKKLITLLNWITTAPWRISISKLTPLIELRVCCGFLGSHLTANDLRPAREKGCHSLAVLFCVTAAAGGKIHKGASRKHPDTNWTVWAGASVTQVMRTLKTERWWGQAEQPDRLCRKRLSSKSGAGLWIAQKNLLSAWANASLC